MSKVNEKLDFRRHNVLIFADAPGRPITTGAVLLFQQKNLCSTSHVSNTHQIARERPGTSRGSPETSGNEALKKSKNHQKKSTLYGN